MSRRREEETEASGQDSFLDVVANLVGVLIILVMVVGAKAKTAIDAAAAMAVASQTESMPEIPDVEGAVKQVLSAENDLLGVRQKLQREALEVALRKRERDQLQLMVAAGEDQLSAAKSKLSDDDQKDLDLNTRMKQAFKDLANLDDALSGVSENDKVTEVVKHYPTPMAKTVFGKELHFRLESGRLCYVPFEEFVARLKDDAPKQMWKLKDTDRVTESIGPLQGFRMRYTLKREIVSVPTGGGMAKGERASLEQFILIPVSENLGEEVDRALGPNSEFRNLLSQYNPKQYTVTLWVYPDSFQHFRKVRDVLLKQGFITAGRPMPEGHPIGGSPEGSRSAAQ